jgi:hypothetical protein
MNWEVTSDSGVIWTVSSGRTALSAMSDVEVSNIQDGQVLTWSDTESKWVNENAGGAGSGANLGYTASPTQGIVTSDTGTDATIPAADVTNAGLFLPAEKTKLAGIEALADVTDAANVAAAGAVMESDTTTAAMQFVIDEDSFASDLATKVPTQQSTKAYIATREALIRAYADSLVVGLIRDRGNFDASVNAYPSSGGSGTAGAILKGDLWTVSVAGTMGSQVVTAGDLVRALVDAPGQTNSNWAVTENNIGYVAENQSNKENTTIDNSTTKYPTVNLLKTGLDLKAPIASPTFTGTVTTPAIIVSSETASKVAIIDGSKNIKSADTTTYPDLTELSYVKGVTSAIQTQLNAKASSTLVECASGFWETVSDKTVKIVVKIPFAGTINETVTICASGTATATFKINTTALGGTANSVSSSGQTQTHSTANTFSAGDDLQITVSSNSSCLDFSWTIKMTRTI